MTFGFIQQLAEQERLFDAVLEFAGTLARHDSFAYEMAKRALNRANEIPLAAGFDFEAAQYAVNFSSDAARAGLQQFTARRAHARTDVAGACSAHPVRRVPE